MLLVVGEDVPVAFDKVLVKVLPVEVDVELVIDKEDMLVGPVEADRVTKIVRAEADAETVLKTVSVDALIEDVFVATNGHFTTTSAAVDMGYGPRQRLRSMPDSERGMLSVETEDGIEALQFGSVTVSGVYGGSVMGVALKKLVGTGIVVDKEKTVRDAT